MANPKLRLGFREPDIDTNRPFTDGTVTIDGFDLECSHFTGPEHIDAWDASFGGLMNTMGRDEHPFVSIPAYPNRKFRLAYIFARTEAGIETPKDLEGKRIGTPLYTQSAMIYIRGHLQHDYGVDLDTFHWVHGAVEKPGSHGHPEPPELLEPVDIEVNTSDKSLSELLAEGEIDAILGSRLPTNLGTHPDVVRLFPDYRAVERDFYRRTKIHPIMHLVVIRRAIYDANPWIGPSLFAAFTEAKNRSLERALDGNIRRFPIPWCFDYAEKSRDMFGDDFWPYGGEANRATLEAFVQFCDEQGVTHRRVSVDELYPDNVRDL